VRADLKRLKRERNQAPGMSTGSQRNREAAAASATSTSVVDRRAALASAIALVAGQLQALFLAIRQKTYAHSITR